MKQQIPKLPKCVLRLLDYSWKDIEYEYDGLTDREKKCITREEFEEIRTQVIAKAK
jgi:hypothetical protein